MYELLSDAPRADDRLGFKPTAEILTEVIATTPPPFTVGIFGEWGSGKTTMMNLIRRELKETPKIKTAWFNAWKYEGKEVVWNALIQCIFREMRAEADEKGDTDFRKKVKEAALNLARFAARRYIPILTGGLIGEKTIDGVESALSPLTAEDEEFDFINKFEETFSELVDDFVGESGRLVVFVDDLDRCLPATAVEVLEAIKLYLDSAKVTFVIGVEPEVVRTGIAHRYKDNAILAQKEYLEKIVQLPFVMRGLDRTAAEQLISPFAKTEDYSMDGTVVDMILSATEANPRRIKRFINTFHVTIEMQKRAGEDVSAEGIRQLALVLLTQMRFREVYADLSDEPGLIAEYLDAIQGTADQRDDIFARKPPLKRIHDNVATRRFFELAHNMDCGRDAMRRWVLITAGDPIKG